MSGFNGRRTASPVKLLTLFLFLITICFTQPVSAEPALFFKSEDIPPATIKETSQTSIGFNDDGDLAVRKGNLTVIMAYTSPYDRSLQTDNAPARMVMNRVNQPISGISVRVSIVF